MNNILSKQTYILKFYAICLVALVHSYFKAIDINSLVFVLTKISCVGVFIFFILSGYFFHPKKGFWKKKLLAIIVPWCICAIIMYGYQCFHHNQIFTAKGVINYFVGNGSFLYFLSMLMACYGLCYFYKKFFWIIFCFMGATVISVFLTSLDILPHSVFSQRWFFTYLNPYLNVFNWIGFFSIGILIQQTDKLGQLFQISRKYWYFLLLLYSLILFISYQYEYGFVYWTSLAIPNILLVTLIFMALAQIPLYRLKYLELVCVKMGAITLPIYMYHETIINKILVWPAWLRGNIVAALARPCLCVLIIGFCCYLGAWGLGKLSPKLAYIYSIFWGLNSSLNKKEKTL